MTVVGEWTARGDRQPTENVDAMFQALVAVARRSSAHVDPKRLVVKMLVYEASE
jgi:hypothetical protein